MSTDNREHWNFWIHPSKETLDFAAVRYWRAAFDKILKIGVELEFNLPNKSGSCKGDNNACPCKFMKTKDCWQQCARAKHCEPHAAGQCHGLFCSDFLSACIPCENFEVDCASCADRYDPEKNPDNIRRRMVEKLEPSQSYGKVTKFGVHSIAQDGSLEGNKGAEIITVGRRINFWEFYDMIKEILDLAKKNGGFVNERTSIHIHILASYYGKLHPKGEKMPGIPSQISELERPIPEIILANLHQLCRRYQNAMTWMSMGLDHPERMTRWEKFRVSVLPISAITNTMAKVRELVANAAGGTPDVSIGRHGGGKYGWVNWNNCSFDEKGNANRFHTEMRVMDFLLSPSAIAAFSCLFHALAIKAVELSRYGILEVGDSNWMERAEVVKKSMMNNTKDYGAGDRFSNTSKVMEFRHELVEQSLDLISQVKHILLKTEPSFEILEKLAERPCALRRCEGESWEDIENSLFVKRTATDIFIDKLFEIIDLRYITGCSSEEEWIREAAGIIVKDDSIDESNPDTVLEKVQDVVENKKQIAELVYLDKIGVVARVV